MSTVLDTLITNRTAVDLANDTDRAYIAYTDLNRVEDACTLLAGRLGVTIQTKAWRITRQMILNRYLRTWEICMTAW